MNSLKTASRKRKMRQAVGAKVKPFRCVNMTPKSDTRVMAMMFWKSNAVQGDPFKLIKN